VFLFIGLYAFYLIVPYLGVSKLIFAVYTLPFLDPCSVLNLVNKLVLHVWPDSLKNSCLINWVLMSADVTPTDIFNIDKDVEFLIQLRAIFSICYIQCILLPVVVIQFQYLLQILFSWSQVYFSFLTSLGTASCLFILNCTARSCISQFLENVYATHFPSEGSYSKSILLILGVNLFL